MEEVPRLTKKERRLLRREERAESRNSGSKKSKVRKFIVWGIVIILIAGAGYFISKGIKNSIKISEIGESFAVEGRDHIKDGERVDYKTNPPTSGPHYEVPSNWGIIDHEIPDEAVLHSLEHGGVWVSYRPGIAPSAIEKLKEVVKKTGSKVLMAPRSKNDKDVALVSWGRSYKFDLNSDGSFDEGLVKAYIRQYINTGPELVPDNMPGKNY